MPVAPTDSVVDEPEAAVVEEGCVPIAGGVQFGDCFTITVLPATIRYPVRLEELVFAATVNVAVPLPLPCAPLVNVIQGSSEPAEEAQKHDESVAIETEPLAASGPNVNDNGAVVYVHAVTVTVAAELSVKPQAFETRTQYVVVAGGVTLSDEAVPPLTGALVVPALPEYH